MSEDNLFYREKVVYKALEEFDSRLYDMGAKPFELKVVGGFALLLEQIRMNDYTDIDYVGKPLDKDVSKLVDQIGLEYGLGRGWLNNDVMMSGLDLDEFEYATGELKFNHVTDLKVISLYALDKSSILRMKVIAIDTSYMAAENDGDFTRAKDFKDVKLLMESLGCSMAQLKDETEEFVLNPQIYYVIQYYNKFGGIEKLNSFENIRKIIKSKGMERI